MADKARKRVQFFSRKSSERQGDGDDVLRIVPWQLVDYNGTYGNFLGFEPVDCLHGAKDLGDKEITSFEAIDPDSQMVAANSGTGGHVGMPYPK